MDLDVRTRHGRDVRSREARSASTAELQRWSDAMSARAWWLRSPITIAAIAVLILNDHVLKAAWGNGFTGKASDVAGVVVVFALGAVLIGEVRSAALTAVGFALLKTVPGVAELLAPVMGGVTIRDATDVVAVLVLIPLVVRRSPGFGFDAVPVLIGRAGDFARHAVVIASGAVAILAISATGPAACTADAVTAVGNADDRAYALVEDEGNPDWFESSDGGLNWRPSDGPSQPLTGVDMAANPVVFEPRGALEACDALGACWRISNGNVLERLEPTGEWLEARRFGSDDLERLPACRYNSPGTFDSIAISQGNVIVSFGTGGVQVRSPSGGWTRVPVTED